MQSYDYKHNELPLRLLPAFGKSQLRSYPYPYGEMTLSIVSSLQNFLSTLKKKVFSYEKLSQPLTDWPPSFEANNHLSHVRFYRSYYYTLKTTRHMSSSINFMQKHQFIDSNHILFNSQTCVRGAVAHWIKLPSIKPLVRGSDLWTRFLCPLSLPL